MITPIVLRLESGWEKCKKYYVTDSLNSFYDEVITCLTDADEILLFGPGEAKGELHKRMADHNLEKSVVGIETTDEMTEKQIVAKVKQYFQKAVLKIGNYLILIGALALRAENNDTLDLAVLGGLKNKDALKDFEVVHFQPFDPVHKRTEATVKTKDGKEFKVTKGAPQVILELLSNAGQIQAEVEKAVNEFAARGFRSLGVARAEGEGGWQFLGVLPLFDPPREDAKATIVTALAMGVKIKMVTGDALAIAQETAKKLGMGSDILDASGLGDVKHDETTNVAESIEKVDGFAQVFPEHNFHIVDVLQKRGHIVGMTGDGVNDAPALKKADCGIAVSDATDAARAAADIVLMAPGLSVIIDAIKESRKIFQRMNSYAIYRIAETLRVLLFMTLAILIFNFYPLTAVMIVMLALLNDGAILSIAYDNVHYKDQPCGR